MYLYIKNTNKIGGVFCLELELEDFLFDCEARKLSPKTIKSYRNNTALLSFLKSIGKFINTK